MADDPKDEVDGDPEVASGATLTSYSAIDAVKNHSSVHKAGTIADTDGDDVPDYRDEAVNEYGTDGDGDNDDLNGNGVDDDEEDNDDFDLDFDTDNDWYSAIDNDRHGYFGCHNNYNNMDNAGSPFHQDYLNATPADRAKFDTDKQTLVNLQNAPRTSDTFIAMKRAELRVNIDGATIEKNAGKPHEAERIRGMSGADKSLERLQASLEGKTDAEKAAILKERFPRQFADYEAGKPIEMGRRHGGSYSSTQNDLPGGATEQPFAQRLYQLFALAVTPPATVTPTPALAPTTPTVQTQTLSA